MSIYQRDDAMRPDSEFEPGELDHLVVGNAARALDPRRTPVSVVDIHVGRGTFDVRIEAFEDAGALWELPFESVGHYQFDREGARADAADVARYREAMARFDRPLRIACDPGERERTAALLEQEHERAAAWLGEHSRFLAADGRLPDPGRREGDERLYADLEAFMAARGLADMEAAFARQFVSGPHSGELVKGHQIVLAQLGLVAYQGKVLRDPETFAGDWSQARRADHIVARLGFVRALFGRLGMPSLTVFRGLSTETPLEPARNHTFVSSSASEAVATSHYESGTPQATRMLLAQAVPVTRIFMTYFETAAMNAQFKEAEVVLLYEEGNPVF